MINSETPLRRTFYMNKGFGEFFPSLGICVVSGSSADVGLLSQLIQYIVHRIEILS